MSQDWACDGCTFVNSGFLRKCELCDAPRSVDVSGPGPSSGLARDEPIVLTDEDDHQNKRGNDREVVELLDDGNPRVGGAAVASKQNQRGRSKGGQSDKSRAAQSVTILDDDEETNTLDLTGPPLADKSRRESSRRAFPEDHQRQLTASATGAITELQSPAQGAARRSTAAQAFTLDSCNCATLLDALAASLRPAVAAATTFASSAPASSLPGHAGSQSAGSAGARSGGATVNAAAQSPPLPTLLDVIAPLTCPKAQCRRLLSSRDVRLLLGPYGTHTLYFAACTALWQESKLAKGPHRVQQQQQSGGAGGSSISAVEAARAAPTPAEASGAGTEASGAGRGATGGSRRGRQSQRGRGRSAAVAAAATTTTSPAGGGSSSGPNGAPGHAPAAVAPGPPEPVPLRPLAPSCPACHTRMLPVGALSQPQPQPQPQQAGMNEDSRAPSDAGQSSAHRQSTRSSKQHLPPQPPQPPPQQQSPEVSGQLQPAQVRWALTARGCNLPPPGRGSEASLESLCAHLREAVGPCCAFLCLRCPCTVDEGGGAGSAALPAQGLRELQRQSDVAAQALRLLRRVRAVLLSAEEDDGDDEEEAAAEEAARGGGGSHAGSAGGGRGRGRGGRKRSRSAGSGGRAGGQAWAKGVGYGGGGYTDSGEGDPAAVQAAQERQKKADEEMRSCLVALLDLINSSCGMSGGNARGGGAIGGGGGALASPPTVLLAALQYGGLPYVLRLLLQNDSLLDMGQRQSLYNVVLSIVRRCTSNMALLELLVVPATDPREATPPAAPAGGASAGPSGSGGGAAAAAGGGGGGGNGSGSGGSDPPLSSVFESLARQCSVFNRSAQELADGAEEDIAAVGLSLELGSLAEEVAAGVRMWHDNMGGAAGILSSHIDLLSGPPTGSAVTATESVPADEPASKRRRRGAPAEAAPADPPVAAAAAAVAGANASVSAAAAAADASRRSEYVSRMRPLQFRELGLLEDHYFRRDAGASGSGAGGEVMRRRLKRITGEISGLATGLPLDWEAAAFVAVDDNRVDVLRALLIPASDTPYANGPFIFDIFLPPEYPNKPPKVQFLTTGGGRVRFNPNLYAEGKVCLSLLGTWAGPSWDPAMSTVLQVLVSIQSMILVSDPYYNEPGWERLANTAAGRQQAADYSNTQRYNTLAFSILPALNMLVNNGTSLTGAATFRDVLLQHFKLKAPEILRQCDEWQAAIGFPQPAGAAAPPAGVGAGAGGPAGVVGPGGVGGAAPGGAMASGGGAQQTDTKEQLRTYTEQVVPQIKSLLQRL